MIEWGSVSSKIYEKLDIMLPVPECLSILKIAMLFTRSVALQNQYYGIL
jgi:hypothetical protein